MLGRVLWGPSYEYLVTVLILLIWQTKSLLGFGLTFDSTAVFVVCVRPKRDETLLMHIRILLTT